MRNMGAQKKRFRIGNLALIAMAALSMLAGAVVQGKAKDGSLPLKLFKQAKAEDFMGDAACADCHERQVAQFNQSAHATYSLDKSLPIDKQGCESCHGPGKLHVREEDSQVIAYSKISPKEVSDACLRCHGGTMKLSHWHQTEHGRTDTSCVSCHLIHPKGNDPGKGHGLVKKSVFAAAKQSGSLLKADEPTLCATCHASAVGQFRMNSHHPIPEGRMLCSDCHDIHPTKAASKKIGVVKEKCVSCHGDIAGPFAFEHDPVAGWTGEGCAECHRAHGTQNPKLLKATSRGLCSQCHTDKATTHYPGRTCWTAGCHVALHGSNTDRRFLQR
jgi:DmsE family decaheme c-type cytochrome